MSSAEVVCCKYLPNITDELSIEQTARAENKLLLYEQSDLGSHCLP